MGLAKWRLGAGMWSIFRGYAATFLGPPDRTRTVFRPGAAGLIDVAADARLALRDESDTLEGRRPWP
jgi:hypothetical protein